MDGPRRIVPPSASVLARFPSAQGNCMLAIASKGPLVCTGINWGYTTSPILRSKPSSFGIIVPSFVESWNSLQVQDVEETWPQKRLRTFLKMYIFISRSSPKNRLPLFIHDFFPLGGVMVRLPSIQTPRGFSKSPRNRNRTRVPSAPHTAHNTQQERASDAKEQKQQGAG